MRKIIKKPEFNQDLLNEINRYNDNERCSIDSDPIPAGTPSILSNQDQKNDKKIDRDLKKSFGHSVLCLTWIWIIFIIITIAFSGISNLWLGKQFLSDIILISLLSSTFLTSITSIILRYLFFRN